MKKLFLLALAVFATTVCSYAQLKEVRGIQTRAVTYDDSDGEKMPGFEFVNENDYDVWVDAELCTHGFRHGFSDPVAPGIRATKSFSLKPQETYVWKCGHKILYDSGYPNEFYVQYKAYKSE